MFSGLESPAHLIIVLVIAMLVLGPKRLPQVGRSLGSGLRQFKASIEGKDEADEDQIVKERQADAKPRSIDSASTLPESPIEEPSPPRAR
jgi:sec-independent protein translocase protein TatA